MNAICKLLFLSLIISVLIMPVKLSAQAFISVDHVDSLYDGKIQPNMPIDFNIRWTNNTGENIAALTNGYRIYLSNNGELANGFFAPVTAEALNLDFYAIFSLTFAINNFSDGLGADTVGIGGSKLFGPGLPDGIDTITAKLSTSVSSDFAGDSLCIDSTFYGNINSWKWVTVSSNAVIPEWGGPYCYEILPSCCIGIRGNFNNSPGIHPIDISDIVGMVSYMFLLGNPPPCDEEADINGDGSLDISDLIVFSQYIHFLGTPPADCP